MSQPLSVYFDAFRTEVRKIYIYVEIYIDSRIRHVHRLIDIFIWNIYNLLIEKKIEKTNYFSLLYVYFSIKLSISTYKKHNDC